MSNRLTYPRYEPPGRAGESVRDVLQRMAGLPFTLFGDQSDILSGTVTAIPGTVMRVDPTPGAMTVLLPEITDQEAGSVVLIVNVRDSTNGFTAQSIDADAAINAGTTSANTTAYGSLLLYAATAKQWIVLWST